MWSVSHLMSTPYVLDASFANFQSPVQPALFRKRRTRRSAQLSFRFVGVPHDVQCINSRTVAEYSRMGLGRANGGKSITLDAAMPAEQFSLLIKQVFPALGTVPFRLCRAVGPRNELVTLQGQTPRALRHEGLKKSALYIQPLEPLNSLNHDSGNSLDIKSESPLGLESGPSTAALGSPRATDHSSLDLYLSAESHSESSPENSRLGVCSINPETPTVIIPSVKQEDVDPSESPQCVQDVIKRLHGLTDPEGPRNLVNVTRNNTLSGACVAFSRKRFIPAKRLDVHFCGERAADSAGPSREFYRLVLKEIAESALFWGPENSKSLRLEFEAFQNGDYRLMGTILAYVAVHGGPLPSFFSPFLVQTLIFGSESVQPSIHDVEDASIRNGLQKVADSSCKTDFNDAKIGILEAVNVSGCTSLQFSKKDCLVAGVCHFYGIQRLHGALKQFEDGLSCLGFLGALRQHSKIMANALQNPEPPTGDSVLALYSDYTYSLLGSSQRMKEAEVESWWRDFVLDLEEEGQLPALLTFLTGLDAIPPLGFDSPGTVTFGHETDFGSDSKWEFPGVNACSLSLRLPCVANFQLFCARFKTAMEASTFSDF